MHARTMAAARVHEFTRVVAARAADDDDDVALTCQIDRGVLALLGRMTDRIGESDVGLRESPPNQSDQGSDSVDWLSRLRGNSQARTFLECQHIALVQH